MHATQTAHNVALHTNTRPGRTASRTVAHTPSRTVHYADETIGFELFRRAIMLRDETAWLDISLRYRPMFISWAAQINANGVTDEHCDDIADRALARAWAALSPERFAQFPNLSTLLGYLRACVSATTIDTARSQNARERAYQRLVCEPLATPEEQAFARIERAELWNTAIAAAHTQQERVVLLESFLLELPPRDILLRHPHLFADIHAVYMAKRHVLSHLQRSPELRQFFDSGDA